MNNKRAVIYCRVSTKEQVEEGNSLVTQEKNCRDFALKNNYEILETYIEQGESAKTADRTELRKMLAFCTNKKNNVNAIIAYKIDRISRNTDDYSQIRMQLKRFGVEIKSTSEFFEDNPAGRFMENIIANVAQFDNEVRTERSVGGMKAAVMEGRYVWNAPIGYLNSKVNGKSQIIPSKDAQLIKELFYRVASSNESPEYTRLWIKNQGIKMCKTGFYKTLHLDLYTGTIRKMGLVVQGTFEPLITRTIFNQVQEKFSDNRKVKVYEVKEDDFPLRRFVQNNKGEYATGAWSKGRNKHYAYYYFRKAKHNIAKDYLENKFVEYLDTYSLGRVISSWLFQELVEVLKSFYSDKKKLYAAHLKKIEDLKQKRNLIVTKNIEGLYSDEITKEQLELVNNELSKLQLIVLPEEVPLGLNEEDKTYIEKFLAAPGLFWQSLCSAKKILFQRFNFPNGIIFENNICRTTETSLLLKAFLQISYLFFSNVPSCEKDFEPIPSKYYQEYFKSFDISTIVQLQKELKQFAEILQDANEEN